MASRSVEADQSTQAEDDYNAMLSTTDVELLKRAWRNEKAAPEILPFQSDLIARVREQIELMVTSQTLLSFLFFSENWEFVLLI